MHCTGFFFSYPDRHSQRKRGRQGATHDSLARVRFTVTHPVTRKLTAELKAERKAAKKLRRTFTAEQVAAASVIQRAFRVAVKTWRLRLRRRLKAEARAERQLVHRVVQVQSACEQCTRIVVAGFREVAMLHWVAQAMQFVLSLCLRRAGGIGCSAVSGSWCTPDGRSRCD